MLSAMMLLMVSTVKVMAVGHAIFVDFRARFPKEGASDPLTNHPSQTHLDLKFINLLHNLSRNG